VSLFEVLLITDHLGKRPGFKAKILPVATETATLLHGQLPDSKDWFRRQVPCVFLEGNMCSIYEVRPSTCRSHAVVTPPEDCYNHGDSGGDVGKIDVSKLTQAYYDEFNTIGQSMGVNNIYGPLPAILLLATYLQTNGVEAFLLKVKGTPYETELDSIKFWSYLT